MTSLILLQHRKYYLETRLIGEIIDPDSLEAEPLIKECIETLQQVATFHLPDAMDRRLLWLAENKESLTQTEHDELLALAEFAEQHTLEQALPDTGHQVFILREHIPKDFRQIPWSLQKPKS